MNILNYNINNNIMRQNVVKKPSEFNDVDLGNFLKDIGENQDKLAFSNIFKYFAQDLKVILLK